MDRDRLAAHIGAIADRWKGHFDPVIERLDPPAEPPGPQDWARLEAKFGGRFPQAFKDFMAVMAAYNTPGLLDVGPDSPHGEWTIAEAYDHEMSFGSWDADMIPFVSIDNGDHSCLSARAGPASPVFYVHHEDGRIAQEAPSFAAWVAEIEYHLGADEDGPGPAAAPGSDLRGRMSQALLSAAVALRRRERP